MLHAMSKRGLQVDLSHFARMERVLTDDMDAITADVQSIAGHYINLDSGDQVAQLLFKELGLKQARPKMTVSGDRESTENDVLVAIQHEHPAVAKILEYKKLSKLRGTYVVPMPKLAKRTALGVWRMFPQFKTTRVPTGRFACAAPNLLAMPNRTKRGREVCEGFITDPGWVFLSCDESQIEPRVVAHRSGDANLINIYHNREDLYSDFATDAFRLPDQRYEDAKGWHYPGIDKKSHRFPSKTCILASIYRVTNKGLLEQMPTICKHCLVASAEHLPTCKQFQPLWNEDNCQDLINSFYLRYNRISPMQKIDDARARKYGYVWDDFGRILHVQAVRSIHQWVVSAALRESGNHAIQGDACGSLKLTMAAVQEDIEGISEVCHPLLPIHDELLLETRADVAQEIGELIADRFRTCMKLDVPLEAEWATANNWGLLVK